MYSGADLVSCPQQRVHQVPVMGKFFLYSQPSYLAANMILCVFAVTPPKGLFIDFLQLLWAYI